MADLTEGEARRCAAVVREAFSRAGVDVDTDRARLRAVLADTGVSTRQRILLGHVLESGLLSDLARSEGARTRVVVRLVDEWALQAIGAEWAAATWTLVLHPSAVIALSDPEADPGRTTVTFRSAERQSVDELNDVDVRGLDPGDTSAAAAPSGWYADPSGRFELRYWDGSQWTEHVSRGGQRFTDPPVDDDPAVAASTRGKRSNAASAVPSGWYADPSGRFELRHWDGSQWTEHVSREGRQFTDPPVA